MHKLDVTDRKQHRIAATFLTAAAPHISHIAHGKMASTSCGPAPSDAAAHAAYVVVSSCSSRQNLGTVIRCAVAFGAQAVVVIGAARFSTHGAHGAQKHMPVVRFDTIDQALQRMRHLGCEVVGIAATSHSHEGSVAVDRRKFSGPTAFVLGDLPHGELSASLAAMCDAVMHASLAAAAPEVQMLVHKDAKLSIALHHFTAWAGYPEQEFHEHKYAKHMYASEKERQLAMDARVREIRGSDDVGAEANIDDGGDDDVDNMDSFGLQALQEQADY